MQQDVLVVIPVYNALDDLKLCIDSLLRFSPAKCSFLLINDASPDPQVKPFLNQLTKSHSDQFQIEENERNLGFVGTVNRGLRRSEGRDVVLLNSDTIVTRGWLDKLSQAARRSDRIASVTPLSNNATICSVPEWLVENSIPEGHTIDSFADLVESDSFADLVESVSLDEHIELPTAHGFCMYITSKALQSVGYFDEENFGKGYGEENDWSCRAEKKGFVNIVDTRTFVYHSGSKSFSAAKDELLKTNSKKLDALHPQYFYSVAEFVRKSPLTSTLFRIQIKLCQEYLKNKKVVLQILHLPVDGLPGNKPGGTERHVQALATHAEEGTPQLFLSPSWYSYEGGFFKGLELLIRAGTQKWKFRFPIGEQDFAVFGTERIFSSEAAAFIVQDILSTLPVGLVHIHHFMHWGIADVARACQRSGVPYFVTIHDYYLMCPSHNLVDKSGKHCRVPKACSSCIKDFGMSYDKLSVWRESSREVMAGAKKVFVPSRVVVEYFSRVFGDSVTEKFDVIGHGIYSKPFLESSRVARKQFLADRFLRRRESSAPFTIALAGDLSRSKGGDVIEKLLQRVDKSPELAGSFRFVVCGKPHFNRAKYGNTKIIFREDYAPQTLMWFLYDADVFLSLSVWPETYLLTGDEVLWAGLPAISGTLGAFAERVSSEKLGWVVDAQKEEEIIDLLKQLMLSRSAEFIDVLGRLEDWTPKSHEGVFVRYKELYASHLVGREALQSNFVTQKCSVVSFSEVQLPKLADGAVYDIMKSLGFAFLKQRYPRLWQAVRMSILKLPTPIRNGFFAKAKKLRIRLT